MKRRKEPGRAYDDRGNVRPADARWLDAASDAQDGTATAHSKGSGPSTPTPVKRPSTGRDGN